MYLFWGISNDSGGDSIPVTKWILFAVLSIICGILLGFLAYGFCCLKKERAVLDEKGFHYKQKMSLFPQDSYKSLYTSSKPQDVYRNIDTTIPLSDIVKFRLAHDELGSFVEVVTTDGSFHICRSVTDPNFHNWVVSAGNAVLTTLTGRDCTNSEDPETTSQDASNANNAANAQPMLQNLETPMLCKFRDDYLSFENMGGFNKPKWVYGIGIAIFILICAYLGLIFNAYFLAESNTVSSPESSMELVVPFLIIAGIILAFFFLLYIPIKQIPLNSNCFLDKEGFHYTEELDAGFSQKLININIPISRILKFRIQNDGSLVFVEMVTTDKALRFFHKRCSNKNGTNDQNWLVTAGNIVLSYLTGRDCRDLDIKEDSSSCTAARLNRNEFIDGVETPQTKRLNVKAESNGIQFNCQEKCPSGSFFRPLLAGLFFLGLAVCSLILAISLIASNQTVERFHNFALPFQVASFLVAIIFIIIGIEYILRAIPMLYSLVSHVHWTFKDKSAIKKRTQFGIMYARQEYDLTKFSYMEIQKFCSFYDFAKSLSNDKCQKDVQYQLILFDNNDRMILEINELELDEAAWIANEIQKVINGSAPNPVYRSLAQ